MRAPFRKRTRRLNLEALEKRDVPATWGVPWPEADHLTLSFVPDGSSVDGQSSQLYQTLDSQLGPGKWETTILNAFQTWAVNSNINVGLVADGGQAEGVAGPAQGDARFGDIRVSAIPLPAGVVAITSPYDPGTGTVSGDMILNSNLKFNSLLGYDLFTVALHEAGHSFGFADSANPLSFMYNIYTGPLTGLAPGAVSALQALYGGPRDITELDGDPDASNPKLPVDVTALITAGAGSNTVAGDLGSIGAANYYQFKAPAPTPTSAGVTVQVQTAGLSQLVPRITVTDASGNQVAVVAAPSTTASGATVELAGLTPGNTYTIRVDAPSNNLDSIGSYMLAVAPTLAITSDAAGMKAATSLDTKTGASPAPATGPVLIAATTQVDYDSFTTPSSVLYGLTAQLQAFGAGLTAPQLVVLNGQGAVVGQAIATTSGGTTLSVHIAQVLPNTKYYLKVTSGVVNSSQFGIYQATVSYAASPNAPTVPILQTPWLGTPGPGPATSNTSLANAAVLQTPAGYTKGSFYTAIEGIAAAGIADYFSIALLPVPAPAPGSPPPPPPAPGSPPPPAPAPPAPPSTPQAYMTLTVQTLNSSSLVPWVTVSDKSGNPLPSRVLTQAGGISVVQVPYSQGGNVIVKVAASVANGGGSIGNYDLKATFGTVASSLATLASGTTAAAAAGSTAVGATTNLTIPSTEIYEFVLAGDPSNTGTDAVLRMTVTNSSGNVVATLTAPATEAASLNVLLGAGQYSVQIAVYSPSKAALPTILYTLSGTNLTDPIKVYSSSGAGSSGTTA